jgi:hypothetical protein
MDIKKQQSHPILEDMEGHVLIAGVSGDRRHELRHAVERPCHIYPAGKQGIELAGVTGNVSRSGLYLRVRAIDEQEWVPAEGDAVLVLVELPASEGRPGRFLECAGRVVRTEEAAAGGLGLALAVQGMKFLTRREASRKGAGILPVQ